MADLVPFTNNYIDQSTDNGYQFEFYCVRCGNGYASSFQHSVTGFGGKLLEMGGDLIGGDVGDKASSLGWNAQWLRGYGERGTTRDKKLAEAVEEVSSQFTQCHRCGQWVCNAICWNERGMCTTCAPKLDQEIAGLQAAAQIDQLNQKIRAQDWTQGINYREQSIGRCAFCQEDTGGGKFCQHCGTAQGATATQKFCTNCGTNLGDARFCGECGWPAG